MVLVGLAGGCGGASPSADPPVNAYRLEGRTSPTLIKPRLIRPAIAPPAFDDPQRAARVRSAIPRLEAKIEAHRADHDISALAAGVVLDGKLVMARGWGKASANGPPVDADTVFRIGSLSKVVTAMAALRLVADGKIGLDDPAAQHLPELGGVLYPTLDGGVITIRHLLTHTAGLPRKSGPTIPTSEEALLRQMDGLALESAPGTVVSYSDLGLGLLGLVVARAAGTTFRDYANVQILGPLGMTSAAWDAGDVPLERLATGQDAQGQPIRTSEHQRLGPLDSSAGLYASLHDLAKLATAQLQAWPPRNDPASRPVPRTLLRQAQTMQAFSELHRGADNAHARATGTGLVWQIEQRCDLAPIVWHNGRIDGHESALFMAPHRGVAVVLLARAKDAALSQLASELLRTLVDEAALSRRRRQPSPQLEEATAEVARMFELGNINEPTYQRLFAGPFRQRVSLQQLRRQLQDDRTRLGPCKLGGFDGVISSHEARLTLQCDRGTAMLHLRLTSTAPPSIDLLEREDDATSSSKPSRPCR
jgi:CubicO group peptidase (beta-lactamase class C family)